VELQALENYDFSTFVAPYQSLVTTHRCHYSEISLLADDAQEKSRDQLNLSHLFPLFVAQFQ